MGTYASQIAIGEGKFRARIVVEGWPEIFVSDPSLVATTNDDREQILGLDPMTLRIAASVDLARAELTEQEQTIEIVDDDDGTITASLSTTPTARTSLLADLPIGATTATVASTAGFAAAGVIHLATEAIAYTGTTPTTFSGLTRAVWNTTQQAHFTGDGERLAFPTVTNRPRTLRGRRVRLYLYGAADSGVGTLRWRGIARTDVSYSEGRYAFSLEPSSWIFEQSIGADLEEPIPIRGVTLPASACLKFRIARSPDANVSSVPITTDAADVVLSGHYADNEAMVAALNVQIAAAISGWSWDADTLFYAEANGPDGWSLVYRVGTTTAYYVDVDVHAPLSPTTGAGDPTRRGFSAVDWLAPASNQWPARWLATVTVPAVSVDTVEVGQVYRIDVLAPTPRAIVGDVRGGRDPWFVDPTGAVSEQRLFLGGSVVPTSSMLAAISPDPDSEESEFIPAATVDAPTRSMLLEFSPPFMTLGPASTIMLARTLARNDTLSGLLATLIIDSPGLVNSGAMPMVTLSDLDPSFGELEEAERDIRAAQRTWVTTEGVSLRELVTHEARLLGVYPAPDDTGSVTWRRLRPPLPTDVSATDLTADSLAESWPTFTRSVDGHLREVLYRQGWDPLEGEHRGLTIRVRNVQGADPTPLGGVLEVAPRSFATLRGDYGLEIDPLDAELLGMAALGMFGGGYRTITVEVTLAKFEARLGDVVTITTPLLPDIDGTLGIATATAGILTGYDWSPFEGRGTLTILLSELDVAGYSPGFLVDSQAGAGTAWTLILYLADYTDQDVSAWLAVGDEVRVIERDTATPTRVSGTVSSVSDPDTVGVTFDAAWTPGAAEWTLSYDTTAATDETAPAGRRWAQAAFAKLAGSDGRVALASGDADGDDLSP